MYLEKSSSQINKKSSTNMVVDNYSNNLRKLNSQRVMFCDYMKAWLDIRKIKLQGNTYETYYGQIYNHIVPYFAEEGIYLDEITSDDIEEYYDYELSTGLSSNTVIRYHSNIFTALKYAKKKNLIKENPMDNVQRPKPSKYIPKFYNLEQLGQLFDVSKNYEIYIVIVLAATLGLRRSEIIGLKWDCIDFNQGTITIRRKALRMKSAGGDIISNKLKTQSSYRSLPIPKFLLSLLKNTRDLQKSNSKSNGYYAGDMAYVCLDRTGHRLELNRVTGQFRCIILKHDLDYIRFHDLRHSCASLLLSLGYSLKQIQEWLGHSNFVTTANLYAHIYVKDKIDMAERLDDTMINIIE